ncbi:hypothetical protein HDU67_009794 [Dinochytrium kinnereticum]|nr:hypothetical protein HDU67_009794 [Dinochytrium kinnereticum]
MARTKSTARKISSGSANNDHGKGMEATLAAQDLFSSSPSTSSSSNHHSNNNQHYIISNIKHQFANLKKGLQDAIAENGSLYPILSLLSGSQLQACLLAFLPSYLNVNTGNIAVDMFLITLAVTACMALLTAGGNMIKGIIYDTGANNPNDDKISVKVEYHRIGNWGQVTNNIHWTALAWLISLRSKSQKTGSFRMATFESENSNQSDDEDGEGFNMPKFNILPRGDSDLEIEHEGSKFKVYFEQQPDENSEEKKKRSKDEDALINQEPPIVIRRVDDGPVDLEWMQSFLIKVTTLFLTAQKEKRSRARYELHSTYNYWQHVQNLRASRGLDSVALDLVQEELLRRDLETYHNDAEFYKRMGLPYRRGYLLSGKPGTGKTSLVNAISATYNRDLYYINLKEIRDDNALQSAFSTVPKKSIIVFEDIDAQSAEVHSRDRRFALKKVERLRLQKERDLRKAEEKKKKEKERKKKEKIKELKRLKKKKKAEEKRKRKKKAEAAGEELDEDEEDEEAEEEESEVDEDAIEVSDDDSEDEKKKVKGLFDDVDSFGGGFESDLEPMGFTSSVSFGPSPLSGGGVSSGFGGGSSDGKFGGLALGGSSPLFSGFTLSALLNCLDGHMMNEDIIIIMTSNHPEVLDPALIRPGRNHHQLSLRYCTHHQLNRMFSSVMDNPLAKVDFSAALPPSTSFPEGVIAPCDALRIMVLYRSSPQVIPQRLVERAMEILNGKPATSGLRAGEGGISLGVGGYISPTPSVAESVAGTLVESGSSSPSPSPRAFGKSIGEEDGDEGIRRRLNVGDGEVEDL